MSDFSVYPTVTFEFPNEVCRLTGPASVQVGSKIYVDGGGVGVQRCSGNVCDLWPDINIYLWELSLEESFTSSKLPIKAYLKPAAVPMTYGAALWRNQAGTQLYHFGGAYDASNLTTRNLQVPVWPTIFGYDIPSNTWFNASINGVGTFLPAGYGHYTSVPDSSLVYRLGGGVGNDTIPGPNAPDSDFYKGIPQLGMMIVDTSFAPQLVVRNETGATGLPHQGGAILGNLVYTPFGEKGTLISLGGGFRSADGSSYYSALLSYVQIFDIASSVWFQQQTSADVHLPNPRHYACSSVVVNDQSRTVDIIFLGGDPDCFGASSGCDDVRTFSRGIDILTLPSFRWFHFGDPQYSPNSSYSGSACHVFGSHLIRIGGWNSWLEYAPGQSCAPLVNVLDLNSLTWTDSFNKSATTYVAPSAIEEWNAAHSKPEGGWTPGLDTVFAKLNTTSTTSGPQSTSSAPAETAKPSGNHTGAIIGGVVGGVAFLVFSGVMFWLYRRKKSRSRRMAAELDANQSQGTKTAGSKVSEMPTEPAASELPTGPAIGELPTESRQVRYELG